MDRRKRHPPSACAAGYAFGQQRHDAHRQTPKMENAMRSLRMLVGAVALTAPTLSFLAAHGGVLPWQAWAGITLACIAVLTAMNYWRVPLSWQKRAGLS
jgi:hypothetical protein